MAIGSVQSATVARGTTAKRGTQQVQQDELFLKLIIIVRQQI